MNLPVSALLAALILVAPARGKDGDMTLLFTNGDLVRGDLAAFDESGLVWESDAFTAPQRFRVDPVSRIEVPPSPGFNLPEGNHIAEVTLTNGDKLRGCLTEVTDDKIGLQTSYAGELILRRDMVDALKIESRPEVIYLGPSELGTWTQSIKDGWSLEDNALVCKRGSSIGREIGRHDRIRFAFDVSWQENARFRLFLHADSENPDDMKNGYELVCQSQYAYLRKKTANDSSTIGSSGGIREFTERDKIRFEILQDLTTGRFRLMIDGRIIDDWQEAAPDPAKMGSFIHFLADHSNGTRISRIAITSWDGVVDGEWGQDRRNFGGRMFQFQNMDEPEPDESEASGPDESQGIKLRNGDLVDGEIVEIADGMVRLKTSFNEFELPVSRLRSFALRTAEEAANPELRWEPIRRKGDIRASFTDGGRLTFQLVGFEDGHLIGRSQTFGEARFDLGVFSSLEFNIYPRGLPEG
ncbi:hypothetical protein [Haloferula sp. A504]|uniref:hypothetical protein n=1 Tax=Haloferula sp. A504 TaxID=3373601 RepID=UPI0031CAB56B|nr:hypothetical protein [Verrucomicrobiaceae bacterium E54]